MATPVIIVTNAGVYANCPVCTDSFFVEWGVESSHRYPSVLDALTIEVTELFDTHYADEH